MTIRNILVPVDFSEASVNALKYATTMAGKTNARLEIVHVYHIAASGDTTFFVTEDMVANHQVQCENKLKELVSAIPELKDTIYSLDVLFGLTSATLLKRLKSGHIDLVVMGTKGETDILSKLIGSTTNDVINNAGCPVLAIPKEAKKFRWSKVAIALDGIDTDIEALNSWLSYVHEVFNSNFYVIHINEAPDEKDYQETHRSTLEQIFDDMPYQFHAIAGHSVERGLIDHMKKTQADVLMIFPRKRHIIIDLFTHKVTKHLCEQMHQPILAYRS